MGNCCAKSYTKADNENERGQTTPDAVLKDFRMQEGDVVFLFLLVMPPNVRDMDLSCAWREVAWPILCSLR